MIAKITNRIQTTYQEYPRPFWVLMMASFVDHTGAALLFPFFAIYVTVHFNVGMKEVGVLFFIWSISGIIGNFIAGALTDRMGRKTMVMFGLVASALSTLGMALINDLLWFYFAAFIVGILGDLGGPAQQAMVADLLPEEQRTEGFALWRVITNISVVIGPVIGGFIAGFSYFYAFLGDAVTSILTALIVLAWIPETMPEKSEEENAKEENVWQTYRGYFEIFKDRAFVGFLLASMFIGIVYGQMYGTLSVFLVQVHSEPAATYGFVLSFNAALVVLTQFAVSRITGKYPPLLMLVLASLLYMIGFGLYGFVSSIPMFIVAMIIITIGEMVHMPTAQSMATKFAPEHMRGRYMAVFSLTFFIPGAIGPYLAGVLMDDFNPYSVWYASAALALIGAGIFFSLHLARKKKLATELA